MIVIIKDSGLCKGDFLNLQIQPVNIRAASTLRKATLVGMLGNGSVVTWGWAAHGDDNSAVRGQLRNAREFQASQRAFAAILDDGSVVTWALLAVVATAVP